ncbi:unnamed protein product [Rotaria sp. Silwood2]|nr:unnamed protein product [Rotaria sp. Silwood2]CAF4359018.1 unnamed protein product [Rotaria sp. Silwood2]
MIQVKRYLNNSNPRHEETKKLKTIYDDRERINCLENLSNELFYEIFDYLDGCELFNAFSNLNNRFRTLLNGSSLRLKINLRFHPETIKQYRSTCIVSRNKDRIISLNLANFYCFNSSFTLFNINSSFSHLESLVLGKMKPNELKSLLINLISLPRLFSLIIHYDDDLKQINNIYQMIVKLPMLKYNKLSFNSLESFIPIPIATTEQFSSIKDLIIDHCCTLDELIAILSYTPKLCRLTCRQINESKKNILKDTVNVISSLTRISITKCYAEYDELEMFLTKISPQVQVLRINTLKDVTYLDANRWARIISQNLLELNTFEFQYNDLIDEDFKTTVYHELINRFNSSFWIKRKWFFKISIQTDSWDDNVIVYSIFPYRKFEGNFQREKTNDEKLIDDIYQNNIQQSIISNKHNSVATSSMILNISDLSTTDDDEPFIEMVSSILVMLPITCLNITLSGIYIATLIDFIKYLPNLDSLVILSLPKIESKCFIRGQKSRRN